MGRKHHHFSKTTEESRTDKAGTSWEKDAHRCLPHGPGEDAGARLPAGSITGHPRPELSLSFHLPTISA